MKGDISALTHALAVSLAGRVRVNSISPGWIETRDEEYAGADTSQHPAGRVGTPEDIAGMVLYLCSERAGFIDGENIAMAYLPEGYPPQKASQQFFGFYRLLKAKKDYVPELAMEYILFQLIFNEVDDIDTINEYAQEGAFDGQEDS